MKYEITYSFKSANGFDIKSRLVADSKEEAEQYCKNIEELENYKLIDITRID